MLFLIHSIAIFPRNVFRVALLNFKSRGSCIKNCICLVDYFFFNNLQTFSEKQACHNGLLHYAGPLNAGGKGKIYFTRSKNNISVFSYTFHQIRDYYLSESISSLRFIKKTPNLCRNKTLEYFFMCFISLLIVFNFSSQPNGVEFFITPFTSKLTLGFISIVYQIITGCSLRRDELFCRHVCIHILRISDLRSLQKV